MPKGKGKNSAAKGGRGGRSRMSTAMLENAAFDYGLDARRKGLNPNSTEALVEYARDRKMTPDETRELAEIRGMNPQQVTITMDTRPTGGAALDRYLERAQARGAARRTAERRSVAATRREQAGKLTKRTMTAMTKDREKATQTRSAIKAAKGRAAKQKLRDDLKKIEKRIGGRIRKLGIVDTGRAALREYDRVARLAQ